jgi:hypothetical protein
MHRNEAPQARTGRRILFANQLGLLAARDERWARRDGAVMADTLVEHPFA